MLRHEPLPRNDVESLSDILTDLRQCGVIAARAGSRYRINNAATRQVLGKLPPRRLATVVRAHRDGRRLLHWLGVFLAERRNHFLKLQFELIDEPLAALRVLAEHLALHLRDHELKMLDHRLGTRQFRPRLDQLRGLLKQRRIRLKQRGLQRILIVGEIRSHVHVEHCSTIAVIRGKKV